MLTGGCHCGAVRYEIEGEAAHSGFCHCSDCRRSAGAPLVAWIAFPASGLTVTKGEAKVYASSENGRRHFCPDCGTGLFYFNEVALPGIVDIQSATLDDPEAAIPDAHINVAERISWMATAHELPMFESFPPQG
ncbi:GFA family protein [Sphingomonas tabacisoli]|uniref:GFA family protein n=1 Tax=Sphingomonas tabacisoli TaxID=2249466 RepID=A0ABW4I5B7_9SPHN